MIKDIKWSGGEKKIARKAFDLAYRREMEDLKNIVKQKASGLKEDAELWQLEDFLYNKRREIDNKYDYRYSQLLFVFGRLLKDGYLKLEDLEGLSLEKISKIKSIADM